MARKTKADAEQTRLQILDAAREVFAEHGLSRTSMEQVAARAGVTRGAVYWHFANKMDLFFAMRDQVSLSCLDRLDDLSLCADLEDPLSGIAHFLQESMQVMAQDARTRRTLEIIFLKCEYVGDLASVLEQSSRRGQDLIHKLQTIYERAEQQGQLRPGLKPAPLAQDTYSFYVGLLRVWLLDHLRPADSSQPELLRPQVQALIEQHVALRRA